MDVPSDETALVLDQLASGALNSGPQDDPLVTDDRTGLPVLSVGREVTTVQVAEALGDQA